MEKSGPGTSSSIFVIESPTCYSGWIGYVFDNPPKRLMPLLWSVEVIRVHDWLSASLRATKVGTAFRRVQIQTPSGDSVVLMNAVFGAFGPAVWRDPTHARPVGSLEMVTYHCGPVMVNDSGVLPTYDWWKLNA